MNFIGKLFKPCIISIKPHACSTLGRQRKKKNQRAAKKHLTIYLKCHLYPQKYESLTILLYATCSYSNSQNPKY